MTDRPPAPSWLARWPGGWPLRPLRAAPWARQPPTYAGARPALIEAAVKRAQARPSGNWFVLGASRDVRRGRPYGVTVAGTELVAWRDAGGRLVVGPGACPHLGAPLAQAAVDCGELVCRWHGLRVSAVRRRGLAAAARLRRRRPGLGAARRGRRRAAAAPRRWCPRGRPSRKSCTPSLRWSACANRRISWPTGLTRGTAGGFTRTSSARWRCCRRRPSVDGGRRSAEHRRRRRPVRGRGDLPRRARASGSRSGPSSPAPSRGPWSCGSPRGRAWAAWSRPTPPRWAAAPTGGRAPR